MSHTPGPWHTWMHKNRWRIDSPLPRAIDAAEDSMRWLVADTVTDSAEDEANARLIAAAPDLLHACKRALAGDWCSPKTCVASGCVCNVMSDAIAKAEGK